MPHTPVKPYPKPGEWATVGLRLTADETRGLDKARKASRQSRSGFVRWLVGAYLSGELVNRADADASRLGELVAAMQAERAAMAERFAELEQRAERLAEQQAQVAETLHRGAPVWLTDDTQPESRTELART